MTTQTTFDALTRELGFTTYTTFDAVVGPFSTFTFFDAVVKELDKTTSTTFDALTGGQTRTSFDALVSDPRGTYRGVVADATERDALPNLKAGDMVDVQVGASEQGERHHKTSGSRVVAAQRISGTGLIVGGAATTEMWGQSFKLKMLTDVTAVDLEVQNRVGTPVDSILVEVLSGSMTGTVEGSVTRLFSVLTVGFSLNRFTFASAITLQPSVTYYIRVSRTGSLSSVNYVQIRGTGGNPYPDGAAQLRQSGVWAPWSSGDGDLVFQVIKAAPSWDVDLVHSVTQGEDTLLKALATDDTGTYVFPIDPTTSPDKEKL